MKNLNKKMKTFLLCLAASPLMMVSESAMAACDFGGSTVADRTASVSFSNVIVQRDAPVGSVIASKSTGAYGGGKNLIGCDSGWTLAGQVALFTTISSYGNGVYDTNIPGIGIRIMTGGGRVFPFSLIFTEGGYSTITSPGLKVELVKTSTGAVGAGVLTTGRLGGTNVQAAPSYFTTLNLSGSNQIVPVACSVNNTVINVNLDEATYSDFSGVGTTTKPKDFNIGLNCDAGTKVKVTLDGTKAGPAGVLSLNAGSDQATGIGIQLVKGSTPVALGTALDYGTAAVAGDMQLPLTARYYQTTAAIKGGTTRATATFTMAYN